jgi:hypothetical protein
VCTVHGCPCWQAHEELWLECAQKLTTVIQQIIEFAKMVPGFMKLSQDDQIVLLKAGERNKILVKVSILYTKHHNKLDITVKDNTCHIKYNCALQNY